jgi:hypothetical protein
MVGGGTGLFALNHVVLIYGYFILKDEMTVDSGIPAGNQKLLNSPHSITEQGRRFTEAEP